MFEKIFFVFLDIFKNCVGYTIYAHNLSSFDGVLILKILYKLFDVKPLFKDNKIMLFQLSKIINIKDKKIIFYFKCSFVLLPMKLKKLKKYFNIDIPKLPFPYSLVKF